MNMACFKVCSKTGSCKKVLYLRFGTACHRDQISWPSLTFSSLKKMAVVGRFFWQLGTRCSGRCKRVDQMPLHGLSARTKKMAVVERKPLVEVPPHISQFNTGYHH